jgi:hypothetical protein
MLPPPITHPRSLNGRIGIAMVSVSRMPYPFSDTAYRR